MQTVNRLKSERPRREYDFYETPIELAKEALRRFLLDENKHRLYDVLDPGAGRGVWGEAILNIYHYPVNLDGIEIQDVSPSESYDRWHHGDYLQDKWSNLTDDRLFDLVVGNPPYSLAEEFIRQSFYTLCEGGYCYFLLRLAFLESKKRHFGLFTDWQPKRVYVLSRRPSFFTTKSGRKTTDALSYAMFLWQKGWVGDTVLDWM
jgi:hypothetical protein